jgi:hypothetical protein
MTRLRIAGALVVLAFAVLLAVVGPGSAAQPNGARTKKLYVRAEDGAWNNTVSPGQKLIERISIVNWNGPTARAFTAVYYYKGQKIRKSGGKYKVSFDTGDIPMKCTLVRVTSKAVVMRFSTLPSKVGIEIHIPTLITAKAGTHVHGEKMVLSVKGRSSSWPFPDYDVAQT